MTNIFILTIGEGSKLCTKRVQIDLYWKVTKFQVHSVYRKKVIRKKPQGGAECAPPVLLGLSQQNLLCQTTI